MIRAFALFLIFAQLTFAASARAASASMRRIAVVVGANEPPPGRPALRFAREDARALAGVLQEVGGFSASDVHVLLDPRRADLLATLDDVARATRGAAEDVLFVFYYSGHSDGQSLFPHGEPVLVRELRDRVEALGARIRVGILDTCRGGSWTQSKGLALGPALSAADLLNVDTEGTVLVSSSSGVEDAHEADAVRGSFFTHHFADALRGAADRERDGTVTLQEAFDYARDRTVRDSARLARAPQHPSFDIALRGRQDVVLATLPVGTTTLEIAMTGAPVEVLQLPSGVAVADAPSGHRGLRLALPAGRYLVRRVEGGRVLAKEVAVPAGRTVSVAEADLAPSADERLAPKGDGMPASALEATAFVHVEGDRSVVLERSERNGPWALACTSPCDTELPVAATYRLAGHGVRSSAPFQLVARPGERVVVRAEAASKALFVGGIVMASAGAALAGAGGMVLLNKSLEASGYGPRSDSGPSKGAGEAMVAGGAAAVVGGALLATRNARSSADQSATPAAPPANDAWLRTPRREGRGADPLAPTPGVPVVQMGF